MARKRKREVEREREEEEDGAEIKEDDCLMAEKAGGEERQKGLPKIWRQLSGCLSGLPKGGACRRINGRGLWWRGEGTEEEVESRPLWRAAISHLLSPWSMQQWRQGCPRSPASPTT